MVYPSSLTSGKTTAGVSGRMTAQQALANLLAGTGLNYRFTNSTTVTISQPTADNGSAPAADGSLVLDTIDVSGRGSGPNADTPYQTPGSVNYISQQDIERFSGNSAGDIFQGTPGVISGSNNNGASIDPNIRGLQGMNRVATTVDGAEQSTSTYRGYAGVDSRTYIDPDLIGGGTVTKGPDGGVPGAIGGTVALRTLNADDILKPGNSYGVRIKGTSNTTGTSPKIGATTPREDESFAPHNGSVSFAVASKQENVDFVGAFVRRKTGNYFAGNNGALFTDAYLGQTKRLSDYNYGQEVFNTSEDSTSALLKATLRPDDGHELQVGYLHYDNEFGEITPSNINVGSGIRQIPLSRIALDQFTARYHWRPANDLVDFRANAFMSNTNEDSVYSLYNGANYNKTRTQNYGLDASNVSRFDIATRPFTLTTGGALKFEDAAPRRFTYTDLAEIGAFPVNGTRGLASAFAKGKWEPLTWLSFNSGIEYLQYNVNYRGTPVYSYIGPSYAPYDGSGFSPSAGVTVTPLEGWQLFATYSTGIRPPSLREASWVRGEQVFNPDLTAEKARNYEVGTNLLKSGLVEPGDKARLKLAYFDNTTKDYIGREYVGSQLRLFNYDYARFRGFELSGGYDASRWFFDYAFNYYTGYTGCLKTGKCYDYTMMADYLSNQMPPRFTTAISGGLKFLEGRATVGARYRYVGDRLVPLVDDGSYFAVAKAWAPYSLVDAFMQWKVSDSVTLDVTAMNLLDRYYVDALNNTDMPAPGRTIKVSLTGQFGGSEQLPQWSFGPLAASHWHPGWTGLYAGGHFGFGAGFVRGTTTAADGTAGGIPATESADQHLKNSLGGAQFGYNYQFSNNIVLGAEADFSWTNMGDYKEALSTESATLIERKRLQARTDYEFEWLSTIRGRLGYAVDRFLVYGTAGVAFLKESEERTQYRATAAGSSVYPAGHSTDYFFSENSDSIRVGWTVGGGAEYKIDRHWSLKGEYLYAGFSPEKFIFGNARSGVAQGYTSRTFCVRTNSRPPCPGGYTGYITQVVYPNTSGETNGRSASNSAGLHMLKIGLNYRF